MNIYIQVRDILNNNVHKMKILKEEKRMEGGKGRKEGRNIDFRVVQK